jgi:hypothetical protein
MSNTENKMPAIAAARGVVNLDLTMGDGGFILHLQGLMKQAGHSLRRNEPFLLDLGISAVLSLPL